MHWVLCGGDLYVKAWGGGVAPSPMRQRAAADGAPSPA